MDTRLGYIGGAISLVLAFFPENNWIKAAFAGVGIFAFLVAFIFHGRKSTKVNKISNNKNVPFQEKSPGLSSSNASIINIINPKKGEVILKQPIDVYVSPQHQKIRPKQEPLELSPNHIAILKVFRSNDGELTSVPLIEQLTGLETIVINSILDDFGKHNLINATNLDELNGGWQYQLRSEGRKKALKFT